LVLTDKFLENVKPASTGKRNHHWDALVPALALRVSDKGCRSWIVQRRVNGRQTKITLGEYPAVKLRDARDKAREKLKEMTRGIDPRQSAAAPVTGSSLRPDSFEGAVKTYIKREVERNRRPRTQDEITRPLQKLLVPKWGTLPLCDIDARKIIEVLDELVEAEKPVAANRTYSVLRRFFRWCVERRLVEINPALAVRKPTKETSRSRALGDDDLREVWVATHALEWPFGPFIRGLILTGQRRNELAGMTWAEIDSGEAQWTIPALRTKNGKEHVVAIAPPFQALLDKAPRFTDEDDEKSGVIDLSKPVFTTTGKTPVSGFSRAKTKLDGEILKRRRSEAEAAKRDVTKVKPLPPWTLHDLRRSCATGMARLSVQPHVIEAVLNHSSGFRAGIAGVYQRHDYLEERRKALFLWASHITSLATPRGPMANVVSFARRAQ
jgi:integrase